MLCGFSVILQAAFFWLINFKRKNKDRLVQEHLWLHEYVLDLKQHFKMKIISIQTSAVALYQKLSPSTLTRLKTHVTWPITYIEHALKFFRLEKARMICAWWIREGYIMTDKTHEANIGVCVIISMSLHFCQSRIKCHTRVFRLKRRQ